MITGVSESTRREYAARMNRVLDHIQAHLAEPLDLAGLAAVACFSPFHFHRLFSAWTGETLQAHIQRLRLERAAQQLVFDPLKPVTEVALDCGFSGSSPFARAFREAFGMPATAWRKRKICHEARKDGQAEGPANPEPWWSAGHGIQPEEDTMATITLDIQVQRLDANPIAYVRHIGPYMGDEALFRRLFQQLFAWAGPRGLVGPRPELLCLYYDNPHLTPAERHRLDVALVVPEGTRPEGEIGIKALEGGLYAVARTTLVASQFKAAWNQLMAQWLPGSGYQPDDRPAMERYLNNPDTDPERRFQVELCLPVRPL